jgi:hypothetical protein
MDMLKKPSTLLDHSNNYIEREFGNISPKIKTVRVIDVVDAIHNRIESVDEDPTLIFQKQKLQTAMKFKNLGVDHYENYECEEIENKKDVFLIESSTKGKNYKFHMRDFYCTCPSFNY